MAIIKAFSGAMGGTFADQWREIVTAGRFDEQSAVAPGVLQMNNRGRGENDKGSNGVLSNGSKIFVPENTAAVIFSQDGIENIISEPGGYEYRDGQSSVFGGDGVWSSLVDEVLDRVGYGGQAAEQKRIAFVNLREIRGLKFGTRGPLIYNDHFYGADLEIKAFGHFSVRIVDVVTFLRHYLPANTSTYNFATKQARGQLLPEFIQSFTAALNSLSSVFRISQLPGQTKAIAERMSQSAGESVSWVSRFGIEIVSVAIEAIEFTPESRALVNQYSQNRMNLMAYDGMNQTSADMSAQQMIAEGVRDHGLGDGGGMLLGMNLAHGVMPQIAAAQESATVVAPSPVQPLEHHIELVKALKELLDAGLLTEEEFAIKKQQALGL